MFLHVLKTSGSNRGKNKKLVVSPFWDILLRISQKEFIFINIRAAILNFSVRPCLWLNNVNCQKVNRVGSQVFFLFEYSISYLPPSPLFLCPSFCNTIIEDHSTQARKQDFEWGLGAKDFIVRGNFSAPNPNYWRPTPNWQIGWALNFHFYFFYKGWPRKQLIRENLTLGVH